MPALPFLDRRSGPPWFALEVAIVTGLLVVYASGWARPLIAQGGDPRRAADPPGAPVPDPAAAFDGERSRLLLERARVARFARDSTLLAYEARSHQRISVTAAFRALGPERVVARQERSARVRWSARTGAHVELDGLRTVVPTLDFRIATDEIARSFEEEFSVASNMVPYVPGQEQLWIGAGQAGAAVDRRLLLHPFGTGAEAHYRYSIGDSVSYTPPG